MDMSLKDGEQQMIELAIVEDEKAYVDQLLQFVDQYQREYGETIHTTCFRDGDEIVNGYDGSYDIILMDIQMKFMDGMTAAEILMLLLGGMEVFDAVTISFATAGTGGFAVRSSGMASYTPYMQWVIASFMVLFGVN